MFFVVAFHTYREKKLRFYIVLQFKTKARISFLSEKSESLTKKSSRKGSWCASTGLWKFYTGLHHIQNQESFLQLIF